MKSQLYIVAVLVAFTLNTPSLAFDRLFTTKEERIEIDNIRYKRIEPKIIPEIKPPTKPVKLHLNGVMSRNGGENTVWINGQLLNEQETINQSKVNLINESDVSINVTPLEGSITLRPGQSYVSTESGTTEGYEN